MHRLRMHVGRNAVAYVALFFALSGTGAMAAKNLITGADIQDGTITVADLAKDSVTGAKILDGSIVGPDLEADSVDSSKILDGSIVGPDLQADSVDSSKILNGSIVGPDLQANSITSAKILDGSIVGPDLQADSVTSDKILDASIVAPDLQANSITSAKILNGTIVGPDLQADTLGGGQIDESSLGTVPSAANADTVGGVGLGGLVRGGGSSFSRVVWGSLVDQESSNVLDGVAGAPDNASITFSCFVNAPDLPALLLALHPSTFLTSWGVRVGDDVVGPTVGGGGLQATWEVTSKAATPGSNDFRFQASDENGYGYVIEGFAKNADDRCTYEAQVTVTGQ
jgi:hypothetical protein